MLLEPAHYRSASKKSLDRAFRPGRVILIHTGAALLLSLLLTAIDYFLDKQISTTGGLSGIQTRTILTTIQSTLHLFQLIALPFWQIGYTYYALQVAHGHNAGFSDLWQGFRRFGPVLKLRLLQGIMIVLLIIACSYATSFLFFFTPWAAPIMEQAEALAVSGMDEAAIAEAITGITMDAAVPILIIFSLCALAGGIFLFFRFRLAEMWLLDHSGNSALLALRSSRKAMRGNFKAMLRIDLSFWWFYLLEILITVLRYSNVILKSFGMEMTTDAFSHYLIFFSLYIWAQMALYWWKRNEVAVTYAHAYMALCPQETPAEDATTVG